MEKLIRIDDAAQLIGVSPNTLRHWRATGTGPPSARLGRRVVYREREVIAWVNAQFDGSPAA